MHSCKAPSLLKKNFNTVHHRLNVQGLSHTHYLLNQQGRTLTHGLSTYSLGHNCQNILPTAVLSTKQTMNLTQMLFETFQSKQGRVVKVGDYVDHRQLHQHMDHSHPCKRKLQIRLVKTRSFVLT